MQQDTDTTSTISQETSVTSQPQTTAILIANPTSGSYAHHAVKLIETISFLRQHGWKVTLELTEAAGNAIHLAKQAADDHIDVVIAAGGDGTINEVIQGLAGSDTALGVIPIGTVNVWAREMGIPLDHAGARDVLVHGKTCRVDLGRVNDRYFLLMVGIGIDGEVTHEIEKKSLKWLGVFGYLMTSIWTALNFENFHATIKFGEREIKTRTLQIFIGNTQLYGGAVKFTWQAKCDDGLLDVCIVHKRSKLRRIVVLMDFLLRRKQRRQWVSYETCDIIEIQTRRPIAMQIDGDAVGYTPAIFRAAPHALSVIVPQRTSEELFSRE